MNLVAAPKREGKMKPGQATGLQIAFLMLAVMVLAVPLADFMVRHASLSGIWKALAEKGTQFALACLVIAAFPRLRRAAWQTLATPVPRSSRREVVLVALANVTHAFATAGALALWVGIVEGPARLEGLVTDADRESAHAFSDAGLARFALAVLVAPIVEELVFRGFIYRAFERQWGWLASMAATSALFGLYHPHFWSAFWSSVVLVCALRRTGSLWAPILIHTVFNLMLWWPLLGQYVFPHGGIPSELSTWSVQLACLYFVAVALPIYVCMARDRHEVAATVMLEPNGTLSK